MIVEKTIAQTKSVPGGTHGEPLGSFTVIAEFQGSELVGKRYEQLLDIVDVEAGSAFRVIPGDFVTQEEGTGIVHIAPAFGTDDYEAIRREEMAFVNPIDQRGCLQGTNWDDINGVTVFEANYKIAERLQRSGKGYGR